MKRLILSLLVAAALPGSAVAAATALVGGTVHPVSGPAIAGGTVLMENGVIVAVGSDVTVPPGAERIDVTGRHVYPGLIAANTVLGLAEINSVKGTRDEAEGGNLNPNARAMVALNADSELIPATRANGILTAGSSTTGGVLSGTSVLWNLQGWNWEEMTLRESLAMNVHWPSMTKVTGWWNTKSEEEQKKEREEKLDVLTEAFDDARAYARARAVTEGGGVFHPVDVRWEAMLPVVHGEMPVFVHADEYQQIEAALDFAAEQEVRVVIVGGLDAPRLADRLAAEGVSVIVDGTLRQPSRIWEPYDNAYTVPARLYEAGVPFCISTGGSASGLHTLRNLPYHAAMAAAYGLPPEEALKSVTLYPAQILGVGERLGSLEPGKDANVIVTDGDPLEILTNVHLAWIAGEPVDLASRHTALYDRYRNRPRTDDAESRLLPSPAGK